MGTEDKSKRQENSEPNQALAKIMKHSFTQEAVIQAEMAHSILARYGIHADVRQINRDFYSRVENFHMKWADKSKETVAQSE